MPYLIVYRVFWQANPSPGYGLSLGAHDVTVSPGTAKHIVEELARNEIQKRIKRLRQDILIHQVWVHQIVQLEENELDAFD